jgi:hypothetical protein
LQIGGGNRLNLRAIGLRVNFLQLARSMIGSVDVAAALTGIGIIAQSRERETAQRGRREKICVAVTIA